MNINAPRSSLRFRGFPALALLALLAGLAALPLVSHAARFENVERIVAVGDVHGSYDELTAILREAGVIDDELAWSGGKAHLVSLGDLLHRGDRGRDVMDLLMRLQEEAGEAGGAVHVLLGNHEVLAMTADFRYATEGDYARFGETAGGDLPPGFIDRREALAPDGQYGRWLLELPAMILIDDSLFLHGGVSELLAGHGIEAINDSVRRDVRRFAEGWHALLEAGLLADRDDFDAIRARAESIADDADQPGELRDKARGITEALGGLPFHPDGPLWYRGNASCHPFTEIETLSSVIEPLGASRVVLGHTPTPKRRINSRIDGKVFLIDTGMNAEAYNGRPSALVIEGGDIRALYAGEGEGEVVVQPARVWARPYGMNDKEIARFLETAEITKIEDIGIGVTGSKRVTLEQNGRRMRALFKTIDTDPGLERATRWSRQADFADRFIYEVAAYQLDRLLGLEMIPVTVVRSIQGQRGSLQYWIENSFNQNQREERGIPFTGHCSLRPQYDLMNVFDILIFNVDRNLGDILYDQDWNLWLVDHSRSFGTQRGIPDMIRTSRINVPAGMREALERVTMDNLEDLKPHLQRRQLQALVSRAQAIRREM